MIFDTEEQKKKVIDLIGEVPVQTTIKGVLSGPAPDLVGLMNSIITAPVVDVQDQTVMLVRERLLEQEEGQG